VILRYRRESMLEQTLGNNETVRVRPFHVSLPLLDDRLATTRRSGDDVLGISGQIIRKLKYNDVLGGSSPPML